MLGLLLWAGACSSALAQTPVAQLSPAQSLSCLQRPERLPKFPDGRSGRTSQSAGFVRVMMHFQAPDQAPRIELMANTASEAMQDQVFSYLSWYRLPCLQPGDGVVKAVQEFSFRASPSDPAAVAPEPGPAANAKSCLVMPRKSLSPWSMGHDLSHVLVQGRFAGGPDAEPEVKLLYSNAAPSLQNLVQAYVAQYRMPCRADADKAYEFEQQFTFKPEPSVRPVAFTKPLALDAVLALLENQQGLDAFFDLDTMACPFTLRYQVRQPKLPNQVTQAGKPEASRLPLIKWLEAQRLAITDERLLNQMFGSTLEIKVGCGPVDLRPTSAAE
ncbi:MAG: hypothetical protein C0423_01510 [Methylibium sp.]|nr:hypothetical protein [Methylibium sp.]